MALSQAPFMGACHECFTRCVREHGSSREICHGRSLSPAPCFYKLVSGYCVEGGPSCRMQLPSAFVRKYLPHVGRKRMVLENADGKLWPVVYLAEHGFFTGWSEFSTANNLAIGDTLVFSFVGEAKFVVHVFGKSGCEKRIPQTNPTQRKQYTPNATQATQSAIFPASPPASKSFAPGFTVSSRPNADSEERNMIQGRVEWSDTRFQTPASVLSHGGTCPQGQLQQGDHPRGAKSRATRGQTWPQVQARALVTKAILRKMGIAPLPMSKHRGFKSNQNSLRNPSFIESDGEIGFDAGSAYGGRQNGKRETQRSFSKDGAFDTGLRWEDEEAAAGLRAFADYGTKQTNGRLQGGPSRHREMASSVEDNPGTVTPECVPEYVQSLPRKPGRPRKYPPSTVPQLPRPKSFDEVQTIVVGEKRKRGRPFKHQIPGSTDITLKPLREIFVSRRRKVTQAEREKALNLAYKVASHLKASTSFVVVMRQSFVYRNFVLGVSRKFANRYMPHCNTEVTLVDEAWHAWYCTWNAGYKYIAGRGWRSFALEHCIEEDDVLLMEILEETEVVLTIKVHIFRVVSIPYGLTGWQSHVCPPNSFCDSTPGVPIEPMMFHPPGMIHPRSLPQAVLYRNQASSKQAKREPVYTEDSITLDSCSSSDSELD